MKQKILIFHPALAPYRIDLFNELNKEFEAKIYFFRKNLLSQQFDTNLIINQLNFTPGFLTKGINFTFKSRMIRFGYINKIRLYKPDIIVCYEFNIMTFLSAVFAKTFYPKTKIYTLCDDSIDVAKKSSIERRVGRILCVNFLDGIIFGNDTAEKWYKSHFQTITSIVFPIIQKEERIKSILTHSKHISEKYIQLFNLSDKNILLFVGRLVEVKNLNFLIEVFSNFVLLNKNAVLVLVGDGNKKTELIGLVDKLNVKDNVVFAGRYENEALYAWYNIADYFILPSTSETFGAVVNESLIAGVPVICSELAGASFLINKSNGTTFNPYDKDELESVFNKVLWKKRQTNKSGLNDSIMPFTFTQRIQGLIRFLKNENAV
jgi:glycosyltransferase involved in cell wall biosynthesis